MQCPLTMTNDDIRDLPPLQDKPDVRNVRPETCQCEESLFCKIPRSQTKSKKRGKSKYCHLCRIVLNSEKQSAIHARSTKHAGRMRELSNKRNNYNLTVHRKLQDEQERENGQRLLNDLAEYLDGVSAPTNTSPSDEGQGITDSDRGNTTDSSNSSGPLTSSSQGLPFAIPAGDNWSSSHLSLLRPLESPASQSTQMHSPEPSWGCQSQSGSNQMQPQQQFTLMAAQPVQNMIPQQRVALVPVQQYSQYPQYQQPQYQQVPRYYQVLQTPMFVQVAMVPQ
ncbi:hypothetical protein DIPPA_50291 [Diplonema papillatum]|nr:hypothetical protein DIPPA_50291 [Diplonema papillatum]